MQQVSCPGCGAPVQFKSAASVMAICEFCKTTLLKDADSVRNLGKMSEVIEDYSPLQIGTSGQYGQKSFSLVGRIQLRYAEGFWNEWYALFEDGGAGWLSDGSGQFTLTFPQPADGVMPLFEKLVPGHILHVGGRSYVTSDVRTAQCTGGQGELPFKVGQGYQARVADFRAGNSFLTLDYSEPALKVYAGSAVLLSDLKAQLLRDTEQIGDAANRYRGKVTALACPSCGAPVKTVPGFTVHIACPSCHAAIDTSGSAAEVLAKGAAAEAVDFTLALGEGAAIEGVRYTVLGSMRRAETDDDACRWSEYLLYAPGRKFLWLIETAEGWQRAEVLDSWPQWDGAGHAALNGVNFQQTSRYGARVVAAVGSFNWRVSVNDVVQVMEYSGGHMRLAAEATPQELTWSRSLPLPLDQLRAWFGAHIHTDIAPHPKYLESARRILLPMFFINAIPIFFAPGRALQYALLGAAAILLPAFFLDKLEDGQ